MNNAAFGLWKQNSIRYESTNLGSDQPHDKIRIIRGKGCLQVLNHHCRVSFLKKKKALLKLSQKVSETPHNPSITTYMPRQGVEVIHIHKRLEETDIIWLIIVGTRNEVGGGGRGGVNLTAHRHRSICFRRSGSLGWGPPWLGAEGAPASPVPKLFFPSHCVKAEAEAASPGGGGEGGGGGGGQFNYLPL